MMDDDFENLAIIEMIYDDGPEICIAKEVWLSENLLMWPPKNLIGLNQRKFLSLTPASDWLEFTEFNVLQRGIKSIREANEWLNFYCFYDNTQDKIREDAEKLLRRKHPVLYMENHLDYNNLFDELKEGSTSTPNVSLADKKKTAKLCFLCGDEASIKCNSCVPNVLCISCDHLYHKHPLRSTHTRKKIEAPSQMPKNSQVPMQIHQAQAQPSTSTIFMNLSDNDDECLLIPLTLEQQKTAALQKPKSSKASARKTVSSDNQNSKGFPTLPLVPMQKPSHMISGNSNLISAAALSKALGRSTLIKKQEIRNEQNLHIVLKREKELQELCNKAYHLSTGCSNDIEEKKEGQKEKTKSHKPKETKQAKTVREKKDKSSVSLTTQSISKASSNLKPTADAGDNKITKKIDCLQSILVCLICGSMGEIQCDQCNSVMLCVKCDIMYHTHLLRSGHSRQKLESSSSIENKIDDQEVERETQKLEIEKPETVTKVMNSEGNLDEVAVTVPLHKKRRPPPALLLMHNINVSKTGSLIESNGANTLEQRNNIVHSPLEGDDVDFEGGSYTNNNVEMCNTSISSSGVASNKVPLNHEMETSKHEIETSTQEIQQREKQQAKKKCVKRIVRAKRPLNNRRDKSLLAKMIIILKGMKKDNKEMKDDLIQIKRSQTVLRNKLARTNTELLTLKELLYVQTPKETITLDRSFVLPKMPIESVVVTRRLERNCLDPNYCDQLAVRFKKFSATDTNDVKPAIKRIMDHIFTYELLMGYSWSGKSDLNSSTDEKQKFSILIGIQEMVRKAATLKLHITPTIEANCKKAIQDNVRRASQNFNRQNQNTKS